MVAGGGASGGGEVQVVVRYGLASTDIGGKPGLLHPTAKALQQYENPPNAAIRGYSPLLQLHHRLDWSLVPTYNVPLGYVT